MDEARPLYEEALSAYRQLAAQNPAVYLPDMAMTLNNLGKVDRLQNRIEDARTHYQEALSVLRKLLQRGDRKYAGAVASVEASLQELDRQDHAQ